MLNSKSTKQTLELLTIRQDEQIQPRQALNQDVVTEYAFAMKRGDVFPPIIVFFDGSNHWLADGFHRIKAKEINGDQDILAEVELGTRREAQLFAVGANSKHGLQRTNADKRKAVLSLLSDPEWSKWSDREIARQCGVDHKTVAKYRKELLTNTQSQKLPGNFPQIPKGSGQSQTQRKMRRHGKVHHIDISNIGCKTTSANELKGDSATNSLDLEQQVIPQDFNSCEGKTLQPETDLTNRNFEQITESNLLNLNNPHQFRILQADVDPPEVTNDHSKLKAQFVIQGPSSALPTIITQMQKHHKFAENVWLQAQQLSVKSAS